MMLPMLQFLLPEWSRCKKGFHPYKLYYFEDYEGEYLSWAWKLPSAEKLAPIPASALFVK